jgi:hypothetical protein
VAVYVHAVVAGDKYDNYAFRFLESYNAHPPGVDHDTVIVLNGLKQSSEIACLFSPMPHCTFLERNNAGYDIGAFQHAAREVPCDMMVFFGASAFFFKTGWLLRMATSFMKHGNAQYGSMGNRGDSGVAVWPHIRTTGFWCSPNLLRAYPKTVTRPEERHPFEHGPACFSEWVRKQGLKNWVITRTRDLLWEQWDDDPEGYHHGSQSDLLSGDRICEAPYYSRR